MGLPFSEVPSSHFCKRFCVLPGRLPTEITLALPQLAEKDNMLMDAGLQGRVGEAGRRQPAQVVGLPVRESPHQAGTQSLQGAPGCTAAPQQSSRRPSWTPIASRRTQRRCISLESGAVSPRGRLRGKATATEDTRKAVAAARTVLLLPVKAALAAARPRRPEDGKKAGQAPSFGDSNHSSKAPPRLLF